MDSAENEEIFSDINIGFDNNLESIRPRPTFRSAALSVRFLSSLLEGFTSENPRSTISDKNVNIRKAFNQNIIRQKKLSCSYDQDKVAGEIFAWKRERALAMKEKLITEVEDITESDGRISDEGLAVGNIVSKMGSLPESEIRNLSLVLKKHRQSRRRKSAPVVDGGSEGQSNTKL